MPLGVWPCRLKYIADEKIVSFILVKQRMKIEGAVEEESHLQLT
jgi:hypothetical protein